MTSMIRCASCGANNRVDAEKQGRGKQPVCGRCHQPLTADPHPVAVTDETFAELVEQSKLPVLVDMWAPWCGPCRAIAPVLEQIAAEMAGRVRIAKLNVDDNPRTQARFGVQGIPTLLIFQDGAEVDRMVGAFPKTEIMRRLAEVA